MGQSDKPKPIHSDKSIVTKQSDVGDAAESVSVETLHIWLTNQSKELELRGQELVVKREHMGNQATLAKLSIEKQAGDNIHKRGHVENCLKMSIRFLILVVLVLGGLAAYALAIGKEQIIEKVIGHIVSAMGGAGSWELYRSRNRQEKSAREDE